MPGYIIGRVDVDDLLDIVFVFLRTFPIVNRFHGVNSIGLPGLVPPATFLSNNSNIAHKGASWMSLAVIRVI